MLYISSILTSNKRCMKTNMLCLGNLEPADAAGCYGRRHGAARDAAWPAGWPQPHPGPADYGTWKYGHAGSGRHPGCPTPATGYCRWAWSSGTNRAPTGTTGHQPGATQCTGHAWCAGTTRCASRTGGHSKCHPVHVRSANASHEHSRTTGKTCYILVHNILHQLFYLMDCLRMFSCHNKKYLHSLC